MTADRTDQPKWWVDAQQEIESLGAMVTLLRPMSPEQRKRSLKYLWDRFVVHPPPLDNPPHALAAPEVQEEASDDR